MVSFMLRPHYYRGQSSCYRLERRLGALRSRSGHGGEKEKVCPCVESNLGRQAPSQSLWALNQSGSHYSEFENLCWIEVYLKYRFRFQTLFVCVESHLFTSVRTPFKNDCRLLSYTFWFNPLRPIGNCTYNMLWQSVTLHFVFMCFVRFVL
jgi:hypothetical protein